MLAVLQCPGDARFSAVAGERVIYSGTVRDEGPATGAHTGAPAARPPSSRAEQLRQRLDQITGTFPPARRCQDGTGSGGSSA
ncbi:MAG: hypothetical protein KatS3mg102_1356 [Planctomycetota bacterium]|nr:MAG: hypothetical protein KatS3mg102_1356 [Planctomycetota bacterium]